MATDKGALVVLAVRVAEQLVATALEGMLTDAASAVVQVGDRKVALALRPAPVVPESRRLGPAAAPTRKKPGPKPRVKRKYTRRQPPAEKPSPAAASAAASAIDLSTRVCRKCFKKGLAKEIPGTDRQVKCGGCGFSWKVRAKANEQRDQGAASPRPRRPQAASVANVCRRCDHDVSAHPGGGSCLVTRCACKELYE